MYICGLFQISDFPGSVLMLGYFNVYQKSTGALMLANDIKCLDYQRQISMLILNKNGSEKLKNDSPKLFFIMLRSSLYDNSQELNYFPLNVQQHMSLS